LLRPASPRPPRPPPPPPRAPPLLPPPPATPPLLQPHAPVARARPRYAAVLRVLLSWANAPWAPATFSRTLAGTLAVSARAVCPPRPNYIYMKTMIVLIIIVIRVTGKLVNTLAPRAARLGAAGGACWGGGRRRGRLVKPLASAPFLRQPQLRVDRARLRNLTGATFSISPWPRCSRRCSAPTRARPPGSRSACTLGRKT
jgi:hypothetical protein